MGRDPAADVASELLLDVAREILAALLAHGGEEGLEVLAHHDVQRREPRVPSSVLAYLTAAILAAPRFRVARASSVG